MMGNTLVKSAALDFGIQWACWAVAAVLKTEKFYDLAGSGTFALLAYQSLSSGGKFFLRQKINTGLVLTWAFRLGTYLVTRIMKDGEDKRFNNVRNRPSVFLVYWTIQGLWVFVTLLPTLIVNSKQKDRKLTTNDYMGWTIWAIGFLFEALGDYQKSVFRANPDNAGKFINTGLWSISRHPNYFGEILMWLGLYLSSTSVLKGFEHVGVISPMFVAYLLINVSGIPLLEKSSLKRWGHLPAYQQYLQNTAKLVPFIW
ncbi:hypothetical protein LOTGIDRAFT_179919 [Lottia gigantea]|uniref:Uncharacterized protein n=1 Tax=Lottia gigantea TaxID=225164 RepID=V3YW10_LOTGI|nr:hypothetical protein LOTGIDRAFT_179919 [Lottia gigantea]ESO82198.1 hypothetical protein LOTGIDRAFT_179919 [Lottia gigantea]